MVTDLIVKILGSIPLPLRAGLGSSIGRLFSLIPTKDRAVAQLQVERILGRPSDDIVKSCYSNFGRLVTESFNLKPLLSRVNCRDFELFEDLRQNSPNGVVALTAHFGNWDLLAAWIISRGVTLTTISAKAKHPFLQLLLESIRRTYGINVLWRENEIASKQILRCFAPGEWIAALIDQDTNVRSVRDVFFGQPCKTPSSLIEIGRRKQARFVLAFIVRQLDGTFQARFREIDGSVGIEHILRNYNAELETLISEHPEQWVWIHKRWRSVNEITTLRSREYLEHLRQLKI